MSTAYLIFQVQEMNRQLEEKLRGREGEIFRLRETTRNLQKDLNSVGSSRRQSRTSSNATATNLDVGELKSLLDDKDRQIAVRMCPES